MTTPTATSTGEGVNRHTDKNGVMTQDPDPAPVSPPPQLPDNLLMSEELRILVLSDMHLPLGETRLVALLEKSGLLGRHDLVALLGDTTAFYGTRGEYERVAHLLASLPLPYVAINGNHEFSFRPIPDESADYGKIWELSDNETQRSQLRRFEQFFSLSSRYHCNKARHTGLLLLGVDEIEKGTTRALVDAANEEWIAHQLDLLEDAPLMMLCHFPLADHRLDEVKYYEPGRSPYYLPSTPIRERLRHRTKPTFWLSGHVHFLPEHPLAEPYQTDDGVWQIHCPDGFGFGRKIDTWLPSRHDDFYLRSISVGKDRLACFTIDAWTDTVVVQREFSLT